MWPLNTPLHRVRSHWSGPLTQDDWCPQGENRDVTTEAEDGVTQLHAEGLQGPTGTPGRGGKGGARPGPQRERGPVHTLSLDSWLRNCDIKLSV